MTSQASLRNYWAIFAGSLCIVAGIYASIVWLQLGAPTVMTFHTDRYARQQEHIASLRQRKVVYASGSSGFYGIRCQALSALIDRPAVNFGLHAGLGLRYLLDRALAASSAGDVIVVGPEWELYLGPRFGEYACDYIMSRRPDYIRALPLLEAIQLLVAAGPQRILTGLYAVGVGEQFSHDGNIRDSIDDFGDRILTASDMARVDTQPAKHGQALPRWRAPQGQVVADILAFVAECRRKGVSVVFVFPPLCTEDITDLEKVAALDESARMFWTTCGVPVLGTLKRSLYSPVDAFDTPYHLDPSAAVVHTKRLAGLLLESGVLAD